MPRICSIKKQDTLKLNKFSATTEKEFSDAVSSLKKSNMQNLVLDLRGNGGGYMLAATALADKFFSDQKLLVYLTGRKTPRQDHRSNGGGMHYHQPGLLFLLTRVQPPQARSLQVHCRIGTGL